MFLDNDCSVCEDCLDTLSRLNNRLIGIADNRLYNIRFELDREVDYAKYKLLLFYQQVLEDICNGTDCGCYSGYTEPRHSHVDHHCEPEVISYNPAIVNHCICGCCPPKNVICNAGHETSWWNKHHNSVHRTTNELIIERIKILIA